MPYLDQAARQLGISEKTLRRWLRLVVPPITPTAHKYDRRYQVITDEDVEVIRAARSELPGVNHTVIPSYSSLAFDRRPTASDETRIPTPQSASTHATPAPR